MKDLIEKISTYNLFNCFLPGILFSFLISSFTTYNLLQENIIIGVFIYYFTGLVISRVGSLFLEPFFKKIGFVKFAKYPDYLIASSKDSKIEELSEINNMYRTISSMFLVLFLVKGYEVLSYTYSVLAKNGLLILLILLILLFIFSYRKQTYFIEERIKHHIES